MDERLRPKVCSRRLAGVDSWSGRWRRFLSINHRLAARTCGCVCTSGRALAPASPNAASRCEHPFCERDAGWMPGRGTAVTGRGRLARETLRVVAALLIDRAGARGDTSQRLGVARWRITRSVAGLLGGGRALMYMAKSTLVHNNFRDLGGSLRKLPSWDDRLTSNQAPPRRFLGHTESGAWLATLRRALGPDRRRRSQRVRNRADLLSLVCRATTTAPRLSVLVWG